MEHKLKTWPVFFEMVRIGRKRFEVRWNDRDFKVGDLLVLQEFDPTTGAYSGRELNRGVADVIDLSPIFDAVVLTFTWYGDSVECQLRAELKAANERADNGATLFKSAIERLNEMAALWNADKARAEKAEEVADEWHELFQVCCAYVAKLEADIESERAAKAAGL